MSQFKGETIKIIPLRRKTAYSTETAGGVYGGNFILEAAGS